MIVAPEDRCGAYDNARRCKRKSLKRYKGNGPRLCQKHYERVRRNNGEILTKAELRSIEAKQKRAAERRRQLAILGKGAE